jgi:NAD(P)-dependent dehydrogenase (short-subunit alcohol dehydrogenase family)
MRKRAVIAQKGVPGATGVRVITVAVGIAETEGLQAELGEDRTAFLAITPSGRVGRPQKSPKSSHSPYPMTPR